MSRAGGLMGEGCQQMARDRAVKWRAPARQGSRPLRMLPQLNPLSSDGLGLVAFPVARGRAE